VGARIAVRRSRLPHAADDHCRWHHARDPARIAGIFIGIINAAEIGTLSVAYGQLLANRQSARSSATMQG
jgi:hypothetical protein